MAEGRIALVTGASRGIGRAVALALAEDGFDLAVHYRRENAAAEEVAQAARALGRRANCYAAALTDDAALQQMVQSAQAELGPVDCLINNAGIASRGASVQKTAPEELQRVVQIHALAAHRLCQLVLPQMKLQPRGDIIMVSSVATLYNGAGGAPYNMGKAAQEALAKTLAQEVRRHGIRVNIVAPGLVETEMGRRLVKAVQGVDDIATLHQRMPFGRVCQPEDVANVVRFLVSEGGGYLTGEKINVHAGGANL